MTDKEMEALDKKIEALKPKVFKARDKYDDLLNQMSALLELRYPERKEEAEQESLYQAYKKSGKTIDFIIDFMICEVD